MTPYGPPDPLADYRDTAVQSLVCRPPGEGMQPPLLDQFGATAVFIIAWMLAALLLMAFLNQVTKAKVR